MNTKRSFFRMGWRLSALSISRKLIGSFVIVAMLAGLSGGLGYYFLQKVDSSYLALLNDNAAILQAVSEIQYQSQLQYGQMLYFLVEPEKDKEQALLAINGQLSAMIKDISAMDANKEDQAYYQAMSKANGTIADLIRGIAQNVGQNKTKEAHALFQRSVPLTQSMAKMATKIQLRQKNVMEIEKTANLQVVHDTIRTLAWVVVSAILFALLIGFMLSRMIVKPLRSIVLSAEQITACNLTIPDISLKNHDEIGELAASFNQMKQNLHQVISQVSGHAGQVAAAAEQLSANSNQMGETSEHITSVVQEISVGTESQLHSVEHGVSIIEEMHASVMQIHAVTESTKEKSELALKTAMDGNQSVASANRQMNSIDRKIVELSQAVRRLGEDSEKIVKANELISEIAKQTNLLALNASIEAARAGDAGKGFSVVADEVRKLSRQTESAAGEITRLIAGIRSETAEVIDLTEAGSKEVLTGMAVVDEAGNAFNRIQLAVEDVAAMVERISGESGQIAFKAQTAVEAVRSIDQVAQAAASGTRDVSANVEEQFASMEEIIASAKLLSSLAEDLQELIGKFRV